MEEETGIPLQELKVDGGISANKFVVQLLSNLLHTRVSNIGLTDVSALGAYLIAGLGSGIFESMEDLESIHKNQQIYSPDEDTGSVMEAYESWKSEIVKYYG